MAMTNFPGGVMSFGLPQIGNLPLLNGGAGAVIFVNSVTGRDDRGRVTFPGANASTTAGSTQGPYVSPTSPLATLGYALTFTLAGRGDIIILMAGHTETLTASVTCSNAAVTIYGYGQLQERPIFTMAGFSIILSGVGCTLANVRCSIGTVANTAGVIQLSGAGGYLYNCKLVGSELTTIAVAVSGTPNCTVDTVEINAATTGLANGILFSAVDQITVINCNIYGIFATAPISVAAATNFLIKGNTLRQLSASVAPVIAGVVTATSGTVQDNRYQSVTAATAAAYLGGANVATNILVVYLQNYGFTGKAGPSSGILIPAVGTIP